MARPYGLYVCVLNRACRWWAECLPLPLGLHDCPACGGPMFLKRVVRS